MNVKGKKKKNQVVIANIFEQQALLKKAEEIKEKLMASTWRELETKGYCDVVVYADDFVCCFQYKREAELFYDLLKKRMRHFGLTLEKSKTRLIYFGRFGNKSCKTRKKTRNF